MRKLHPEAGSVMSSFTTGAQQLPSDQAEGRDVEIVRYALSQHSSLLHKVHDSRKSGLEDERSETHAAALQLRALSSRESNGWKCSEEAPGDQSGKASSMGYNQNVQQKGVVFGQNETPSHSVGSDDASKVTMSLQIVPSWSKHYGTLNSKQMMAQMPDPKAEASMAQHFCETAHGNLQENRLIMQGKLASSGQGSFLGPSTASISASCKQLYSRDVTYQGSGESISKKRMRAAFGMVSWCEVVKRDISRLPDIRNAELAWAQATNRRPEEAINEADMFEKLIPIIRAKKRAIYTTQLMQQVFPPTPAVTPSCSDTGLDSDCVAHSTARLTSGDHVCTLTGQLPSNTDDMSEGKPLPSKTTNACKFAIAVECFKFQVKKLESDILRLDKSPSLGDLSVDALELEKFSVLNRFANFSVMAYLRVANPGSFSLHKMKPQRYVTAVPMPKVLPEEMDCLSL